MSETEKRDPPRGAMRATRSEIERGLPRAIWPRDGDSCYCTDLKLVFRFAADANQSASSIVIVPEYAGRWLEEGFYLERRMRIDAERYACLPDAEPTDHWLQEIERRLRTIYEEQGTKTRRALFDAGRNYERTRITQQLTELLDKCPYFDELGSGWLYGVRAALQTIGVKAQ